MIKHYQPSLDGVECSLDVSIDGIESTYGNRMFGIFREWEGRTACFDLVSVNFDRTPTKDRDGYFGMKHEVDGLHRVINQQGVDLLTKQAEIDALKAQNAELLAAQEWQPIESAPKDGRPIAVLDDQDRMIVAYWHPYPRNGGDFRTSDGLCSRLAPEMLLGWTALSVPDYDSLGAIAKARGESV